MFPRITNSWAVTNKRYRIFYLKLFCIHFSFICHGWFLFFYLKSYYEFTVEKDYTSFTFNSLIWMHLFFAYVMGIAIGVMLISLFIYSFKIIRENLKDDLWQFVRRKNVKSRLSRNQVYDKCISCISSLKWKTLEEKKINAKVVTFDRIIGITNFGITLMPDIFIIDISESKKGYTTALCSIRPGSITFAFGAKKCQKRLNKLTDCLASEMEANVIS